MALTFEGTGTGLLFEDLQPSTSPRISTSLIFNDVRSHELGGHSTGPFLDITRSPNLPFNKSIVTRAVWLLAPSC